MIFLVRDVIDSEKDAKLVRHVFMTHSNSVKNNYNNNKNKRANNDILEIEFMRK